MPLKPLINIKNINVTYFKGKDNEIKALQNINLEIYPGEFVIFFGPSGCGKSTLLYSIAGLQSNVSGNILIEERNLTTLSPKEIEAYHQKKTGMIFQAYYLINSLSVLKNVILPQIAINSKIKYRKEQAARLLKHFGVLEQANKLPLELSGGQQQRIAICRALINDPDILLADEPVGNLDSKSAHDVMSLIQELNTKQKKTIILVTHNPAYINFAHRVFYMRDGKIIETKVNRAIGSLDINNLKSQLPKELELLVKTYSSILPNQASGMLIPFKAKQIVSDVLTEMTLEEMGAIGKKVERVLTSRNKKRISSFGFVNTRKHKEIPVNKIKARSIANKIKKILNEIKFLEESDKKIDPEDKTKIIDKTALKHIRSYLLGEFNVGISQLESLKMIDQLIRERLENKIDRKIFQKTLDLPLKKGGAGLDRRMARKIAQRLELLLLGKYK